MVEHIFTRGLCSARIGVCGVRIAVIRALALILHDEAIGIVREVLGGDHDDIHQRADAKAPGREQPEDARADLADVEAVDAQIAKEDGEEQRHEPVFLRVLPGLRVRLRFCSAFAAGAVGAAEFADVNRPPAVGAVFGFHFVVPPYLLRALPVFPPIRRGRLRNRYFCGCSF